MLEFAFQKNEKNPEIVKHNIQNGTTLHPRFRELMSQKFRDTILKETRNSSDGKFSGSTISPLGVAPTELHVQYVQQSTRHATIM